MSANNEQDLDTKQNIAITKRLAARIRGLGAMGETYEDVLTRLVEEAEIDCASSPCCNVPLDRIFDHNLRACLKCGLYYSVVDGELSVDHSEAAKKYIKKVQADKEAE